MNQVQTGSICIIAGEASGDAQGALLIKALKEEIKIRNLLLDNFWGSCGPLMKREGAEDIIKVEDIAVFGLVEIISHYSIISNAYKKILNEVKIREPKIVILIDYPGFNLKLMQDIYALGNTVIYHIPPKVWSHGLNRLQILKNYSHLVTSILPFEVDFFKKNNVNVSFIGNPLKDKVDDFILNNKINKVPFKIGLLPGSRKNEIKKLLPILIESFILLSKKEKHLTGALPIANTLDPNFVKEIAYQEAKRLGYSNEWINNRINFGIGNAYEVMASSSYAWVCSGTATLETAFFKTPMCVIYKVSPLTGWFAKRLIMVKYVSLVNLIRNAEVIPEYLQENAKAENLVNHALKVFHNNKYENEIINELEKISQDFPKNAAKNAAHAILDCFIKFDVPVLEKFRMHNQPRNYK